MGDVWVHVGCVMCVVDSAHNCVASVFSLQRVAGRIDCVRRNSA